MRGFVLLPILAIALVASCSVENTEATRSAPKRDLTLATQSFESAIASPLERNQPKVLYRAASIPGRSAHRLRSSIHIEPTVHLASMTTTIPVEPTAQPVSTPTAS